MWDWMRPKPGIQFRSRIWVQVPDHLNHYLLPFPATPHLPFSALAENRDQELDRAGTQTQRLRIQGSEMRCWYPDSLTSRSNIHPKMTAFISIFCYRNDLTFPDSRWQQVQHIKIYHLLCHQRRTNPHMPCERKACLVLNEMKDFKSHSSW